MRAILLNICSAFLGLLLLALLIKHFSEAKPEIKLPVTNTVPVTVPQPPINLKIAPPKKQQIVYRDSTMKVLLYEHHYYTFWLTTVNQAEKDLGYNLSSPKYTTDSSKFIFVTGEQDDPGELFLYDTKTAALDTLVKHKGNGDNTPKKADWLTDQHLIVLVGYGWGHSSWGGDIFIYNLKKRQLQKIIQSRKNEEIEDFSIIGNKVTLLIRKFNDDQHNPNESTTYQKSYSRSNLLKRKTIK